MVIEDSDLLSANATLITGILIFLTIAPISGGLAVAVFEKRYILYSTYGTVFLFIISISAFLFSSSQENRTIGKYFFMAGLFGIGSMIAFIADRLRRAKIKEG
ncbi:MAG: hypothetical protein M3156_02640 [Thermoproteota archaeon]|nr:hypothetical protein [Thermoproteota archaeon]